MIRPSPLPSLRLGLPLILTVLLAAPAGAAEPPRVFLTWNAPYGQPRATGSITVACGDTTRADTLYLCFDPIADSPTFNGFTASVDFRAVPPDTLAAHWHFGQLGDAPRHVRVLLEPDSSRGVPSPFSVQGIGRFGQYTSPAVASVKMIYAVPWTAATPVRGGRVYLLARVVVSRPPRRDRACVEHLCVEWSKGSLAFKMGDERFFERGNRFASLNAAMPTACATFMQPSGLPVWRMPVRRDTLPPLPDTTE